MEKSKFECDKCRYYDGRFAVTCEAFKEGIPFVIVAGQVSHRKKYPNQKNNIVFEEKKSK